MKNRLALIIHGVLGITPLGMSANFVVDNGTVGESDDGRCGLIEAIQNANSDKQLFSGPGECPAGKGSDDIQLPVDGEFLVSEPLPSITSAISVAGAGSAITIESGDLVVESDAQLELEALSLTFSFSEQAEMGIDVMPNGTLLATNVSVARTGTIVGKRTRASIRNEGALAISHSTISSVGLRNSGTLTFEDSALQSYRDSFVTVMVNAKGGDASIVRSSIDGNFVTYGLTGGVDNLGSMTISESIVSNNFGETSGAISNSGDLNISSSLISGNTSGFFGGGIINRAKAELVITNSTVSRNTAGNLGGGIFNVEGGAVEIRNSTIAENLIRYSAAGGFQNNGTAYVTNTLIANNLRSTGYQQSEPGVDCQNEGTITTNRANWIADGTCSPESSGNPKLGPLVDNGGPTKTHALRADSGAIDAGDNSDCPATDQRRFERFDGACDIGSFEFFDLIANFDFEISED